MRNHCKVAKKIAVRVLLFAGLFYIGELLIFELTGAGVSSFARKILNQMYMDNSIEAGFFGGSQILHGVDCDVAERELGEKVANLTSSQQPLVATDAVLRETADHHPEMKTAYVSLDYSLVMAEEVNLESIYIVSDAMKPSWNKIRYLFHATPQEYYLNSFLPLKKGEEYTLSMERIRDNLTVLMDPSYQNSQYVEGFIPVEKMSQEDYAKVKEQYAGRAEKLAENNGQVQLPSGSEWAIRDMVAFCQQRDIHLVFFATPVPEFLTDYVINYGEYVDAVQNILKDSGVTYLDYNCSSFERSRADYFHDEWHLSETGATEFTGLLCKDLLMEAGRK